MLEEIINDWQIILEEFKKETEISNISFKTWIEPLKVYGLNNNVIILLYDNIVNSNNSTDVNSLGVDYITKKYSIPLKAVIVEHFNKDYDIKIISVKDIDKIEISGNNSISDDNKKVSNNQVRLNPKYTFDTFIVGSNNNMAYASAVAVADSPGETYNPLFIYGGVGLGKTHLMHSIAHHMLENNPNANVLYVTSEQFTNELIVKISSAKNSKDLPITDFREKYRNLDCLLIDDIQFIIGKERTQLEFFHTFNELTENKKQIVISSDKPPKDFDTLEERLRSRFDMGLTVDIQSPDYETRMAILKNKKDMDNLDNISEEVLSFIANNVKSNIRELEGALTRLVAYSKFNKGIVITTEIAERELKDYISRSQTKVINADIIRDMVAEHFNISKDDIISSKKSKNIAFPRQIFMYLCRTMTSMSLDEIGAYLGGKDHSTVLYGCNKIEDLYKKNSDYKLTNDIDILIKKISPDK